MADVNANIGVSIDTSEALAQLKALQRQISQFHSSIARSSESAALAQKSLQKNLIGSINSIGAFSAELRTVRTSAESFTNSLEKNKFSMREYFRYAGASTKSFGRLFKTEFDTIGKVAEERVKTLQTQYIKMGRNASGAMEAIAIRPTSLNMQDYGTKTAIAAQKQALFNQLMKQGTTNLLNFGKNTQWAGRQLMVGFTIPLSIVGSTAVKTFMDMEAQALKFRKVYGDLFTPKAETQVALDNIVELGRQFTKYGVAVSQTVGLAAEAAAAGFQGLDLQRQTVEATRLSVLGQIDSQKALETTISLQNAFGMSSEKLADSINFLNAVENQTVVSLDDITTAIPKVAPVIQQLGGDVKDLTFFIAAMKEGGINASEGANALKSGLAALINPTKKASDMLASFGINATDIVEKNKGDLKATVIGFANALNTLDPLARARAIEQMFGKFQFARLSTLFANVAKDGNQAARVLDLANSSVEELSALSEQELGMTADSAMNKFKKSVEDLKLALIPVGKAFLEAATPIVEFVGGVLEKFGNLSEGTKRLITILTVGIGAVGPILLMTFGLLANGLANALKGIMILRQGYLRLSGQSQILGEQTQYLNTEQLEAAAAAHSLDQSHAKLTQQFTAETAALQQLIAAYQSATRAGKSFMLNNPGMMLPPRGGRKLASGIVSVPGPKGAGDIVPAMLSPGEAVIPSKMAQKYAPLINGMIADNIPGFEIGKGISSSMGMVFAHGAAGRNLDKQAIQQLASAVSQSVSRNLAQATRVKAFTNFGFIAPEKLNKGQMSGTESGEFFQQNAELATSRIYKSITNLLPSAASDPAVKQDVILFGKNIGQQLSAAGSKAVSEPEFYNAVENALQKTMTQATTQAFRQSVPKIQKQITTIGAFGGEINRGDRGQRIGLSRRSQMLGFGYEQGMTSYKSQTLLSQLQKQGFNQGQQLSMSAVSGAKQGAAAASPSKKTIQVGQDIARGLEVGMQNRQKNVKQAGANLSGAAISGIKNIPFQAPGQGVPMSQVAANVPVSPNILGGIANNQRTGGIRGIRPGRALMGIGTASMAASMLPGKAGDIGMKVGGLAFVAQALMILPGPLKLVAGAFAGLYGITKLLNIAREKERKAIEGFADAITITKDKAQSLGDFFSVIPTTRAGSNTVFSALPVKETERTQIQALKRDEQFKQKFEQDIKTLSAATTQEVSLAFQTMALDLRGMGFAQKQIDIIIKALAEEAGKSDVALTFKQLDLTTEEGANAAVRLVEEITNSFSSGVGEIQTKIDRIYGNVYTEITNAQKKQIATSGQELSNVLAGITGQLRNNIINATQYNGIMNKLMTQSTNTANASYLFQAALQKTNPEIAKLTAGMKDAEQQGLILQATLLGFTPTLQALFASLSGARPFERAGIIEKIKKELQVQQKEAEALAKELFGSKIGGGTGDTARQIADKRLSTITNFFSAQEALIKQNRKSQADLLQTEIDNAEKSVDAAEKKIDAEQKLVDINQRQIDLLNRRVELEFDRPIQKLQDESATLNNNLDIIRKQEDAINNQYDKQIESLQKISSINQEIAGQEKTRLTIADALTSGDIAAAAAAVQDARAQAAASRIDQQTKAIEASRQQALTGLAAGGMTKDQIESRTYQIGQQTFLLEQQRKTLQNEISTLQDKNYTLEQGIYSIKQTSLIPAQANVDKAKLALDEYNKQTDALVNGITYLGKTQTEWDNVKVRVEAANSAIDLTKLGLTKASALTSQIFKDWNAIKDKTITITTNYVTGSSSALLNPTTPTSAFRAKMYGGKIKNMNMGGMVPKYFANGGKIGSDTVPAMLTPGEFVMNKKATKSFGPLLSMLNESKYPSMIGSSYDGQGRAGVISSVNDNSSSVYNYNVGITVPQSNANPNDIARAVIGQIKYIDNQRIRGQK
jgi:TP901 family phage tail tape measure protein